MDEIQKTSQKPNIFGLMKPYKGMILLLMLLALCSNALSLFLPKIVSHGIDAFVKKTFVYSTSIVDFVRLHESKNIWFLTCFLYFVHIVSY
jgi:ATP-binding cassette subfamily B protein